MKPEVLVVTPMPGGSQTAIEQEFTARKLWLAEDPAAAIAQWAPGIRGIATTGFIGADARLIGALPKLEIIACFGVGVDLVDLNAAKARGVIVTNTPDVLTDCVADLALALLLATARRICAADRFVRSGGWNTGTFPLTGKVSGSTCGIIGLGRIGAAIAKRAAAFGMPILYHGPRPKAGVSYRYCADLAAMARDSDFLVVACPGGPATQNLVNARILQALGPQGTLINISRGSVVDEPALVAALQDRSLGAAGLDVFASEPKVPAALLGLDNVVLLPHIGSGTNETRNAMGDLTVANLRAHFAGKPVPTRVA